MTSFSLRLLAGVLAAGFAVAGHAADQEQNQIGHFTISGFAVDGNTLLAPQEIERVLAPYTGADRDFGDVQHALEALEDAYHQRGYSVVRVALPEQELNQGVVHLQAIETRIGKVTVSGNRFFDEDNIRRSLPSLREGQTPDISRISTELRTANQNPAKRVRLDLKGGEADGEVDAALKVEDEKLWRVGANLDNTGTSSTGKTHLGLLYQNANISGHDDVMSLQYTTSVEKPSQVSVYGAGYHLPLYRSGDSLDLYGSYSNVDSGSVSAGIFDLNVSGKGAVYGGRYNIALKRRGDYDGRVAFGLDVKAFRNNVQLLGVQLGNDVTVHPLSVTYSGTWTPASFTTNYYVSAVHNLPGGEQGGNGDFARARSGARAAYNLFRFGASLAYALPRDWQTRFNLSGQWTRDALIPGEQFGAGGAASVRGFNEREVADDKGYGINAELYTPELCANVDRGAFKCRALVFYDAAHLSRVKALPGESTSSSIASFGVGMRVALDKRLSLQADVGRVTDAGGLKKSGDMKLSFALAVSY